MKTKKRPETYRCGLCGATWGKDDPRGLAHMLVAHGPLVGASPRKRKRVRAVLPAIFRQLEAVGFDELQAHQVIQIMAEELRKAGLVLGRGETVDRCPKCGRPLWEEGVIVYQVRMGHTGDGYDGDPDFFPEEDAGYYCSDCLKTGV